MGKNWDKVVYFNLLSFPLLNCINGFEFIARVLHIVCKHCCNYETSSFKNNDAMLK